MLRALDARGGLTESGLPTTQLSQSRAGTFCNIVKELTRPDLCENPACRGRSDGYQQSKWSRRGIFSPPICPFKEVQGVELCAVIGAHSFVRCRADADPRQGLESARRTKRCAPTLCCAGE